MKLSDIKISKQVKASKPNEYKMRMCRNYFNEHKTIDRDIVINQEGLLVDGYIGYLVLVENHIEDADVVIDENMIDHPRKSIYLFGSYKKDGKEYCWRVTNKTVDINHLAIGNRAIVKTRYGMKTVVVNRIEECEKCPVSTRVKKVCKCLPS